MGLSFMGLLNLLGLLKYEIINKKTFNTYIYLYKSYGKTWEVNIW